MADHALRTLDYQFKLNIKSELKEPYSITDPYVLTSKQNTDNLSPYLHFTGCIAYKWSGWGIYHLVGARSRRDLQGNNITIIFQSDFQKLKDLKILQLSENQIHTIERDAFLELNSLERLKLSNNRLSHLPDGLFVRLRHLQRL
ncbi:unnamed protein product [Leptidea sinapis]|uniref:Uncharacterized protein n=1 Tax=Leptidea sinapis TaxID=189913 RepID=A0A5E4PP17_9NEOP|nr:unnamed protein product [Leptidea sinapis]